MYKDLMRNLYIYINAIHILSTGYLLFNLKSLSQLNEMTTQVKEEVVTSNPEYDIVLERLYLYYDNETVAFGINDSDLIIQFPLFVQPYSQSPLTLYQIEVILVPIIDQNTQANSCIELQISKPYITLNEETYISQTSRAMK